MRARLDTERRKAKSLSGVQKLQVGRQEMRDQASGARLIMAVKKLKESNNYTATAFGDALREHGYTAKEYFEMIKKIKREAGN